MYIGNQCPGCGEFFKPWESRLHEKCEEKLRAAASLKKSKKQGWDRGAYNAYQREYMRKRRAAAKQVTP